MEAKLFIQALRNEVGHDDARANEDFRAPIRKVHFDGPNGVGEAPVVAESRGEAIGLFDELVAESGGTPGDYEVTAVTPDDDEVEALKEENELVYSHLHRKADRRKHEMVASAIESVDPEEVLADD